MNYVFRVWWSLMGQKYVRNVAPLHSASQLMHMYTCPEHCPQRKEMFSSF